MHDLTMSQVLKDPLIRQMLRADKVSLGEFAMLLERAASKRGHEFSMRPALPMPTGQAMPGDAANTSVRQL